MYSFKLCDIGGVDCGGPWKKITNGLGDDKLISQTFSTYWRDDAEQQQPVVAVHESAVKPQQRV
jgi:hypothetical protein